MTSLTVRSCLGANTACGGGVRIAHTKMKGGHDIRRTRMDYTFLSEQGITWKVEKAQEIDGEVMALLVLKDVWHNLIWVYSVEGKGVTESEWVSFMIQADMGTCGLHSSTMFAKTDQEPAIKLMQ